MTAAAFTLNRMLVATMRAERENSRRAKHDALTGLLNRERLISAIASTYPLGEGISAAVSASIGIAMMPEHGSNAEGLLAAADAALYEAKSARRSRCCMASAASSLAALRRLQVGIGARAADSVAA